MRFCALGRLLNVCDALCVGAEIIMMTVTTKMSSCFGCTVGIFICNIQRLCVCGARSPAQKTWFPMTRQPCEGLVWEAHACSDRGWQWPPTCKSDLCKGQNSLFLLLLAGRGFQQGHRARGRNAFNGHRNFQPGREYSSETPLKALGQATD